MACSMEMLGAIVGSFLLLRLLMYAYRKLFRIPINAFQIGGMGFLVLAISTVARGYGSQDYAPEPLFLPALFISLAPVIVVTIYELRHHCATNA